MQIQNSKNKSSTVISSTEKEYLEHLLLCLAFAGCDTTSQIYDFSKKSIFSKLEIAMDLQSFSEQIYRNSATVSEIGNASIRVFELLNSTFSKLQ